MKMEILKHSAIKKPKFHIKEFSNICFYIFWNNWKILALIQFLLKNTQQENSLPKETGRKSVLR